MTIASSAVTSSMSSEKLCLLPVDLNDAVQYSEFQRQRVICGWASSDEALQDFNEKQKKGLKALFWIMIPPQKMRIDGSDQSSSAMKADQAKDATFNAGSAGNGAVPLPSPASSSKLFTIRAGHISLDSYANPPDEELAREDKSIMIIQTFFMLPEYRVGGIGKAAMNLIERLAKQEPYGSPKCHTVTLTVLSRKYTVEEGFEWKGIWKRCGLDVPPFILQDWYQKLGYVSWKEEPRYDAKTLDGETLYLIGCFMRKRL